MFVLVKLLKELLNRNGAVKWRTRLSCRLGGRGGQVKVWLSDAARVA
jgi:hypothetical protein